MMRHKVRLTVILLTLSGLGYLFVGSHSPEPTEEMPAPMDSKELKEPSPQTSSEESKEKDVVSALQSSTKKRIPTHEKPKAEHTSSYNPADWFGEETEIKPFGENWVVRLPGFTSDQLLYESQAEYNESLERFLLNDLRLSDQEFRDFLNIKYEKQLAKDKLWGGLIRQVEEQYGKEYALIPNEALADKIQEVEEQYDEKYEDLLGDRAEQFENWRDRYQEEMIERAHGDMPFISE